MLCREGSSLTLECQASGNPEPTITWKKENSMLPSGLNLASGPAVVLSAVEREDGGLYVCMADNGVGSESRANISLTVLHPPEISIQRSLHTAHNTIRLQLTCTVRAEPRPNLRWYKDTMLLDPSHHRQMETDGERHSLVLHHLKITDFGNYSCLADNGLGSSKASILVSGRPEVVRVTSPHLSLSTTEYTLHWQTVSLLAILDNSIKYRYTSGQFRLTSWGMSLGYTHWCEV